MTIDDPAAARKGIPTAPGGWWAVTAMAVAVGTVTTTEVVPIGLLPQMSLDLGVSVGSAGLSVTLFGLLAGLLAPVMVVATGRWDRRTVVLVIVGAFAAGNLLTALAPSFPALLAVRLAMGALHGLMWAVVARVAVRLVRPGDGVRATAAVFSGISAALVLGVPAGAAMAGSFGWRAAFGLLSALAAVTWCALSAALPRLPPDPAPRPAEIARLVTDSTLRFPWLITAVVVIGNYCAYTYLTPLLIAAGFESTRVALLLMGYGIVGVAGNLIAGALATRRGATVPVLGRLLVGFLTALSVSMTGLFLFRSAPPAALILLLAWGLTYAGLPVLLQTMVFAAAPDAREAATSVYVLVFNVSIALGAFAGGLGIDRFGPAGPLLAGALTCCAGAIGGFLAIRRRTA